MKYSGYFRRKVDKCVRTLMREVKSSQATDQGVLVVRYIQARDAGQDEQIPEQPPVCRLKSPEAAARLYRMRSSISDMISLNERFWNVLEFEVT